MMKSSLPSTLKKMISMGNGTIQYSRGRHKMSSLILDNLLFAGMLGMRMKSTLSCRPADVGTTTNIAAPCVRLRRWMISPGFATWKILFRRNVEDLVQAQPGRYFKVNLKSLAVHRTVEFRQHSGTLNALKVRNWLAFIDGFVRESCRLAGRADQEPETVPSLPALQPRLGELARMLAAHPEGLTSAALLRELHVQPHSLRANMTYLRRAGLQIETVRHRCSGETLYRLGGAANGQQRQPADSGLFAGIPQEIARFYHNRALVLNSNTR
jgi:hypothetical protein